MHCEICNLNPLKSDEEKAMQACHLCGDAYGLQPMPPPGRPARPCSCGGMCFIRVIPREHSVSPSDYKPQQLSAPMLLTHLPKYENNVHEPLDLTRGVGRLEVYVCKACGRVEWFCSDVDAIPVHPHLMTDLVDYGSGSPYR